MFEVTISQVLGATEALNTIRQEKTTAATAFRIARVIGKIEEIRNTANGSISNLVSRCAQKDENGDYVRSEGGQGIMLIPEQIKTYNEEINELYAQKVQVESDKIKAEDLEGMNLSVDMAIALEPFIEG